MPIILGNSISNNLLDSSIHGLVLTSISQTLNKLSIKKSYPKISKHYLRFKGFNLTDTDFNDILINYLIFLII